MFVLGKSVDKLKTENPMQCFDEECWINWCECG